MTQMPEEVMADPTIPFSDSSRPSKHFDLVEPVGSIDALTTALSEALEQQVDVICQYPHGIDQEIDEEHPAVLYVAADEVFDGRTVRGVLVNAATRLQEEAEARTEAQALAEPLKARLLDGDDLGLGDLNTLLRGMLSS